MYLLGASCCSIRPGASLQILNRTIQILLYVKSTSMARDVKGYHKIYLAVFMPDDREPSGEGLFCWTLFPAIVPAAAIAPPRRSNAFPESMLSLSRRLLPFQPWRRPSAQTLSSEAHRDASSGQARSCGCRRSPLIGTLISGPEQSSVHRSGQCYKAVITPEEAALHRKVVAIGNSRGVSIPVEILNRLDLDAGSDMNVELDEEQERIVIASISQKEAEGAGGGQGVRRPGERVH
jgi:bifunctional DNA-binding transcriptional regulator/antitoxin component of YhaV-PrlF toxin-antitoxin module